MPVPELPTMLVMGGAVVGDMTVTAPASSVVVKGPETPAPLPAAPSTLSPPTPAVLGPPPVPPLLNNPPVLVVGAQLPVSMITVLITTSCANVAVGQRSSPTASPQLGVFMPVRFRVKGELA